MDEGEGVRGSQSGGVLAKGSWLMPLTPRSEANRLTHGRLVCSLDYRLICDTNGVKTHTDEQFQEKNRGELRR